MRFLFFLILISTLGSFARAQQQDPGLLLQTRNEGLAKAMFQNKSFYEGQTFKGTHPSNVREFNFTQRFGVKEFATRDFRSAPFWQGDVQFTTKEAGTKTDSRDLKLFETKAAEVKDARESGQSYEVRNFANTPEFIPVGKSQKSLDQAKKEKMNIDQVRELLNKNK